MLCCVLAVSSCLGSSLFDAGYCDISSTDISDVVIAQQRTRHAMTRAAMKWIVADCTDMTEIQDGSYDVIIDKATADTLQFRCKSEQAHKSVRRHQTQQQQHQYEQQHYSASCQLQINAWLFHSALDADVLLLLVAIVLSLLRRMFSEVYRVLSPSGVFIMISPRRRVAPLYEPSLAWHVQRLTLPLTHEMRVSKELEEEEGYTERHQIYVYYCRKGNGKQMGWHTLHSQSPKPQPEPEPEPSRASQPSPSRALSFSSTHNIHVICI